MVHGLFSVLIQTLPQLEDLSSLSPETCASAGIFVITADPNLWQAVLRAELDDVLPGLVEVAEDKIYVSREGV